MNLNICTIKRKKKRMLEFPCDGFCGKQKIDRCSLRGLREMAELPGRQHFGSWGAVLKQRSTCSDLITNVRDALSHRLDTGDQKWKGK